MLTPGALAKVKGFPPRLSYRLKVKVKGTKITNPIRAT
jgi:hypothetical protein